MSLKNNKDDNFFGGMGLLYAALFIAGVLVLAFNLYGCAMNVHKPTPYKGKDTATKPYVDMGKMYTSIYGCDGRLNTCQATMYTSPQIHNPTKYFLKGRVHCKFTVVTGDAWKGYSVTSKSKDIVILGPKGSKSASVKVDVRGTVEVPGNLRSSVTSSCWFRYKKLTSDTFLGPRLL